MAADERWEQLERLLEKEKKSWRQADSERLQNDIASLLASPPGRESIPKRLNEDRRFPGKLRFLRALLRAISQPRATVSALAAHERQGLLQAVLDNTTPRQDPEHWEALWLLHKEGAPNAAELVLESFKAVPKTAKANLVHALMENKAWERFPRDRAVDLLEAAKRSAASHELKQRLTEALDRAKSYVSHGPGRITDGVETQAPLPRASVVEPPLALIAPPPPPSTEHGRARADDREALPGTAAPAPAATDAPPGPPLPRKFVIKYPASSQTPTAAAGQENLTPPTTCGPPTSLPPGLVGPAVGPEVIVRAQEPPRPSADGVMDLARCLGEVSRVVERFVQEQVERADKLEQLCAGQRAEIAALREITARREEEVLSARSQAQRETEGARKLRDQLDLLEKALAERERELGEGRAEVARQAQEIEEARREAQAAHRRAEDYVHQANRERDNAVRTFKAELWEWMQMCLTEVLSDGEDESQLNPDQQFFRQRLREIRDVLRDQGIPPY